MINMYVLIVSILAAFITYLQSGRILPLIDYTYQIENAYRIYIGQIPYRDFVLVLPPGTYAIMALIMKLFGLSNTVQTYFLMVMSILIIFLTYYVLKKINNKKTLTYVLLLPLVVSGYSIYPFPSYDISAMLFMLVAWALVWWIFDIDKKKVIPYILLGLFIPLPSFFKQNTGYVFTVFTMILAIYAAYSSGHKEKKKIFYLIVSCLFIYFTFILYLILTHSLSQYLFQTFVFPSKIRDMGYSGYQIFLDFFNRRNFVYYASFSLIFIVSITRGISKKIKEYCIFVLFTIPTIFFPIVYSYWIYYKNPDKDFGYILSYSTKYFFSIWYVILGILLLYIEKNLFNNNLNTRRKIFYFIFSLGIIVISLASFLSQGVSGSTYGLYPILVIALSLILKESEFYLKEIQWYKYVAYLTLIITSVLSLYIYQNVRLSYFSKSGIQVKATISGLEHISTPGPWINEMENMIAYVQHNIPKDDSIVALPGEDPLYYLTKRTPPLPYFQYLTTTFPYSDKDYAKAIMNNKIKWVIFKRHTQFEDWKNPKTLLVYIAPYFGLFRQIPGYDIYKRIR